MEGSDPAAVRLDYVRSADQLATAPVHHPVIVVGAGPVGLACAIDLARHGVDVVVLDEDDTLASGSRAICFAKRTLEIFDRLGCGERMVEKGVSWQVGRVFFRDALAYQFDLLPEAGHRRPAFINLQQVLCRGILAGTRAIAAGDRPALAQSGQWRARGSRRCGPQDQYAGRRL